MDITSSINVINSLVGLAINAFTAARVARDAARAASPTAPGDTFPSDQELIQRLFTEAKLLDAEATELRAWLKTLPQ